MKLYDFEIAAIAAKQERFATIDNNTHWFLEYRVGYNAAQERCSIQATKRASNQEFHERELKFWVFGEAERIAAIVPQVEEVEADSRSFWAGMLAGYQDIEGFLQG